MRTAKSLEGLFVLLNPPYDTKRAEHIVTVLCGLFGCLRTFPFFLCWIEWEREEATLHTYCFSRRQFGGRIDKCKMDGEQEPNVCFVQS